MITKRHEKWIQWPKLKILNEAVFVLFRANALGKNHASTFTASLARVKLYDRPGSLALVQQPLLEEKEEEEEEEEYSEFKPAVLRLTLGHIKQELYPTRNGELE